MLCYARPTYQRLPFRGQTLWSHTPQQQQQYTISRRESYNLDVEALAREALLERGAQAREILRVAALAVDGLELVLEVLTQPCQKDAGEGVREEREEGRKRAGRPSLDMRADVSAGVCGGICVDAVFELYEGHKYIGH